MSGKALVLAVVGAGSVVVAAAGGFLALRANPRSATPTSTATIADVNSATPVASAPLTAATPSPELNAPRSETTVPVEPVRNSDAPRATAPAPRPKTSRPEPPPARPAVTDRYESTPASREATPAPVPPAPAPAAPAATAPPVARPSESVAASVPATEPIVIPPPAPRFEELTVKEDSVIGIRLEQSVSSETAKVEDRVTARVTRDVTVDGRTAIPAGSKLEGTVTAVTPGGRFKERARLGVRFHSLVLADGAKLPLQTETIYRDGDSPTGDATAKIGASAVVGAIIGAAIGGKKGAAIGGAAGAAGGTGAVMAGGNKDATIAAGVPLTVRLTSPATVTIEKDSK